MELIPYAKEDRWLTAAIDGDDDMMKHLGGAIREDQIDALCRRFGFRLVEERDLDFRGHRLRVNDWVLVAG
ncbi:hypothetical protein [Fodinicola acaciae]|uniref:hypothetical protein n=1 Tax=Fodinicola acaciae TaxID=2681555 RepID=UPI0013D1F04B|nr:hypothetical protein [Fodinicola acaciae]